MKKLGKSKIDEEEVEERLRRREGSRISVPRLIGALVIAAAVISFAFMQGYFISYLNYKKVSNMQDTLRIDLLSTQLSGELLFECDDSAFVIFSRNLDRTGALLSLIEEKFGKDDPNVLEQKKQYVLLEIQHFLAVKKYKKNCNEDIDVILFFYSNKDKESEQGQFVGDILGKIKDQRKQDVMIYSFDYDLDMDIIELIKEIYGVKTPNSVVINDGILVDDIKNIDDVNTYIN